MIKETVHKAWFPGMGKSSILLGCYGAHTESFVPGLKEDRPKDSEK